MTYQNQNRDTTQELKAATGLSELTGYPRKIADAVVPVINVNPKDYRTINFITSVDYTVPIGKLLYITNINLSADTDGSATTTVTINIIQDGETKQINYLAVYQNIDGFTGAAIDNFGVSNLVFPFPILLKGNEEIEIITAGGEGYATVLGYLVDDVGY